MKHLLYTLPYDIQEIIWKVYFTNNVILEIKKQKTLLQDTSDTRRNNDMIMIRYHTEWS